MHPRADLCGEAVPGTDAGDDKGAVFFEENAVPGEGANEELQGDGR